MLRGFNTSTQITDDQQSQDVFADEEYSQHQMDDASQAYQHVLVTTVTALVPVNRNVSTIEALYHAPSTAVQPPR